MLIKYLLIRYLKSLLKSAFIYDSNYYKKSIVSYGFPQHAFSYSVNKSNGPRFSYGEYLINKYDLNFYEHISISTYNRNKSPVKLETTLLKSHTPLVKFKFFNLIANFVGDFFYLIKSINFSNFFLKIIEITFHNESRSLSHLIDSNDIYRVYKLATANMGILPYINRYHHKIFNYVYSQNFCEFPTRFLNSNNPNCTAYDLADFSVDAFLAFGPAVGYTNIWSYVNNIKKCNGMDVVESQYIQSQEHCLVGYECVDTEVKVDSKYILYFDVNPYSDNDWKHHLLGNIFLNFDLVKSNILDILVAAKSGGYKVVLKPKYDLSKYSSEYINILKKFNDILIILNPYQRYESYLLNASIILNHPYTTTKILAEYYSDKSYFYLSEENAKLIDKNFIDNNFIVGKSHLISLF